MFPKLKFTKEQIEDYYSKVTPDMVRTSLAADRPTYFDLLNLLSPAAAQPGFREALRETAMKARRRYYGKTVSCTLYDNFGKFACFVVIFGEFG